MAVKASASITLTSIVDIQATYRYYLLQSSTLSKPSAPTTNPPSGSWDDSEPTYTSGSTNSLYYVDLTVFSNGSFQYSEVSLSTAYEAAKEAYNKAQNAQDSADNAQSDVDIIEPVVNNAVLDIDAVKAMISTLVTGENGESLMTQTDTGWTFSMADIFKNMDAANKNIDSLDSELNDATSTIDTLKQNVEDLGEYTEYIKFTTVNGQPAIILGETDSSFKVQITNTTIEFLEGSDVPAYISNQSLYIKKAVIEEELQQGGFVWKVESNDSYSLIWKGV